MSVHNHHSSHLPVISGVPQGSILGLLLFLIFVNDLPNVLLSSFILLFADNTKCVKTISEVSYCHFLQGDLNRLYQWSQDWNLHFDEEKCVVTHFSTRNAPEAPIFNYNIHGQALLVRNCHCDLGLLVTSNLHWNEHYDMLLKKAYKTLGLIRRIFQITRVIQAIKTSIPYTCLFQTAILLPHLASSVHK